MLISDVLRSKSSGSEVATVRPDESVRALLARLAEHNFGALIVSNDGETIAGIVSERDIVRRLHEHGARLLDESVSSIMTVDVHTCHSTDDVAHVRGTMTDRRIRHLPVVDEGRLVGLVSIGDVVKSTISELETEKEQLVGYITS
ncbi:CBS domain-containing protein [Cryptosporangium arvum]|uniref:Putative signal-transduction protein containing cAMP-binding and CBS domains n=1 Tax=Cryptosporangium arvum DSM 44712 TaxID=927661 RepID=A0A010YJ77_9ACTN|nr:CBS domain-containing protein [Cryptosporangium arvum]EXG80250.1 putative signal-transduction protein containing cAMP-binding and CBS domains [Cryptosporangium arvum DSM 44712]